METQLQKPVNGRSLFIGIVALISVLFTQISFGQTPVPMSSQPGLSYTENFADIANWTNNFAAGIGANRWGSVALNATGTIPDGVRTTAATATFVASSSTGVQRGTGTIVLLSTGTTDNSASVAIDFLMDFTGVNAGTLSFDWAALTNGTGNRASSIRVYYSTNNSTFTELSSAAVLDKQNSSGVTGSITTVALPAAFNGTATARLRFYEYNGTGGTTGSRARMSIDNLTVTATPVGTATLADITQPTGSITQGTNDVVIAGFTLSATAASTFNSVTVTAAGTATSTDVTAVRIFRDNDGNGAINGADASVSGAGVTYAASMLIPISGETGITTARNYLIVLNVAGVGVSTVGADVTLSIASGAFSTNASTNTGSATGNQRIIQAPVNPQITITGTLNAFNTAVGTPSAQQSYLVSGTNLTMDITITPPVDFEISLNGTTWVSNPSTIVLPHTTGTVASTTIFVQYNPATAGSHSGSITNVSDVTSQSVPVSGTSIEDQPLNPSTVSFGTITSTTMEINFSLGTGSSRIVVLSPTNAVTYSPSDGAAVTGVNNNFSLAADQGSTNKIVYDASGNTVTVTNLAQGTTYHVAVYEYNGTGATSNYLSNAGLGNAATTVIEPSQIASINFGCFTDTSIALTFTGGDGAGRIVVMNGSGGVNFVPSDGIPPTGVNSNFSIAADQGGGDKIVYGSTGTSLTITGLVSGTTYFIQVFEYNGSGANINYLVSSFASGSKATSGALSYSVANSTYSQDFNGMPSSGTFTMTGVGPHFITSCPISSTSATGWQFGRTSGSPALFRVGGSSDGAVYDFGNASDRAFGIQNSGGATHVIGVAIMNNTGSVLTSITVGYTGEEWRDGPSASSQSVLRMSYLINGTSVIGAGTFTPVGALDFAAPTISGTGANIDGNNSLNRLVIAPVAINLNGNWLPGQTLILKWEETTTSSSDGLSIEDFTFVASPPAPPTVQDHDISFSNISTDTLTTSWLNGDGNGRVVIMNTVNSFTNPVDGTTPTANRVYSGSGEQVVYNGAGSTVNVKGLTAGGTYFFRVYGSNGSGAATVYNTTTATLNPNSVTTTAAAPPTELIVTSVNNGGLVIVNQPFSISLQAQDINGNAQNVLTNTTINIYGIVALNGTLSGNLSGVMTAGTNTLTISGILYNAAEDNVVLGATAASGDVLNDAITPDFDIVDFANHLAFGTVPAYSIVNDTAGTITVNAARTNNSIDPLYSGSITLSVNSGPVGGNIAGTLTQPTVNGVATFTDIQFTLPGTYTLAANSSPVLTQGISSSILVTPDPVMNELVIPKYVGCKTTATTNTDRTPFAMCVKIDNLVPGLAYDIRLAVDTVTASGYGAGNFWTGAAYTGFIITSAFIADGSGSSGPYWMYCQQATSRFEPGGSYNFRMSAVPTGTAFPTNASLVGSKVITALDIPVNARTVTAVDDGAFIVGHSENCISGKYILMYDNEAGTGDPLNAYQARVMIPTQTSSSSLPVEVTEIYAQSGASVTGDYTGVIPITGGVRRIEVRNYDNTIFSSATDADGIWPSGLNTNTLARRAVGTITATDAHLGTVTSLVASTTTNVNCFGASTGVVDATASSSASPITYVWSPGGSSTNLPAGTYSVVATDQNGCSASAQTTVTENTQISITATVVNADCNASNGSIDVSVSGGVGPYTYVWSDGPLTEDRTGVPAGSYTVTITDAVGCTGSNTFSVLSVNNSSPITVVATPPAVCPGGSSTLTASGAITYTWSPATDLSATTGATVTSTPTSTITYTVAGTDGFGCQSNALVTVTVHTAPVIVAGGPLTICNGSSVALSTTEIGTYLWSPNGETTSSISATTAGNYSVTVDYGDGCVMTSSATVVTVNNFEFSGTMYFETMGNSGGTTTLNTYTGWSNSAPITYQTTNGADVRVSNASPTGSGFSGNSNVFFTNTAPRDFIISGINTLNYSNLVMKFGVRQDQGVGSSDTIKVEVSSDGVNYSPMVFTQPSVNNVWAFYTPTGTIPATANLRIRFSKAATGSAYRIDDVSISGTTSTVTINPATALTTCSTAVRLGSSVPTGIVWSYNSSTANPLSITAVGPFTTTVTATGTNGCSATSASVSGEIYDLPATPVTDVVQATCTSAASITITSPIGLGLSYSLNDTDYTNTSGVFTNVAAGSYTPRAMSSFGCKSAGLPVVINPAPAIVVTGVVTNATCLTADGAIDITATGSLGTYTYLWADGPTTEDRTGLMQGSYSVTVSDANSCATTKSFAVAGISNVPLTVTATPSNICSGSSSVLNASGAVTYSWSPATGLDATTGATVTATLTTAQTYTATGIDADGCVRTGTVSVSIISNPTIDSTGSLTICTGSSVTLSTAAVGTYLWSPGGETTQSISASAAGPYSVTVDYGGGCVLTSSTVTVSLKSFEYTATLYSETMGVPGATTPVTTYTGWQNGSPITYTSTSVLTPDVRTSNPSNLAGMSGGGNIFIGSAGTGDRNVIISGINTSGYSNLALSFSLKRDAGTISDPPLVVEVSSDGSTYTPLTVTQPTTSPWAVNSPTGSIPSASNLRIRFSKTGGAGQFRVDDIKVIGTITTVTITPAGSLTTCNQPVTLISNIPAGNAWSYDASTNDSLTITATGPYSTTVTATGTNGCTLTSSAVSGEIFPIPSTPVATVVQPTCATATGSITVDSPTGAGYSYSLDGNDYSNTTGVFTVASGSYSLTAKNSAGCVSSALSITINNQPPTPSTPTATVTQPTCTTATGSITVDSPTGAGYSYSLDGNDYSNTTGLFTVASGSYSLTAKNSDGCVSAALAITINAQPAITIDSVSPASSCPGTTVSIYGTGFTGVNSVSFNGTAATFTVMSSTQINAVVPVGATSGLITVSNPDGCSASSATFTVTSCAGGVTLNLKVFIEGYYTGGGKMDNFGGGGCLSYSFVPGADPNDADTMRVTLINPLTLLPIATQVGILKVNGNLSVTFSAPVVAGTSYYIKLTHRNAIQTWSAAAISMSAITTYDFTTAASQAYGSNQTQTFDGMGWMIYSGDISDANNMGLGVGYQDETVEAQDYLDMENAVGLIKFGYVVEDITGDGLVEAADYLLMENNVAAIRFSSHP